jgi:hypothetical protein
MSEKTFMGLCSEDSLKRSSDLKCFVELECLHFKKTGNHAY